MPPAAAASEASLEFYHVNGTEYTLPDTLITGNPPLPSAAMLETALVIGVVLLAGVAWLQRAMQRANIRGWKRFALQCLIILNFFAVLELSLHTCASAYGEPPFIPDPVTFWRVNRDLADQWLHTGHDPVAWWERGPRPLPDQGRLTAKPASTLRVIFFGESQLVSIDHQELNLEKSYPRVLSRLLQQASPQRRFDVINAGVPGYSSWQGLLLCQQLVSHQPDVVVFAFGYHDSLPAYASDRTVLTTDPRVHRIRRFLYQSQLFLLLRKLVVQARESEEERQLHAESGLPAVRVPLQEFEANMRELAALGRTHGFRVAFILQPLAPTNARAASLGRYHALIRRVAPEIDARVLDVGTQVSQIPVDQQARLFDDEIHMSSRGHAVVGRILADEMRRAGLLDSPRARGVDSQ